MKRISIIGATSPLGIDLATHLARARYSVLASFRDPSRVMSVDSCIARERLDLSGACDFTPFLSGTVVWLAHLDQGRFNDREAETNVAAFEKFLAQAANSTVEKIVFVSSGGSVYGEPREMPIREEHPLNPLSSYGKAKAAMESILARHPVPSAILRPGNIYGFSDPNGDHKGIVAAFLYAITTGKPFTLIHGGRTVRDFIHVDDVVSGIRASIETDLENVVWNVATGVGHSAAQVVEKTRELTNLPMPEVNRISNFISDVEQNVLSIERITRESTWRPLIALDEGLEKTVRDYLPDTSA